MDALALLCNLHADGPLTLHKLRERGYRELAQLFELQRAELILVLGGTPSSAERFLREARLLEGRLGAELLEQEDRVPLRPESVAPSAPESGLPPGHERRAHFAGRPVLDAVLEVWRERDALAPPQRLKERHLPVSRKVAPDSVTASSFLDLPSQTLLALARGGVADLPALARADAMQLVADSGLGYTEILRLQFLARRALPKLAADEQVQVPHTRGPGTAGASDPGSAGPFA